MCRRRRGRKLCTKGEGTIYTKDLSLEEEGDKGTGVDLGDNVTLFVLKSIPVLSTLGVEPS